LKREAVSRVRIFESLLDHPEIVQKLYEHFERVATTPTTATLRENPELVKLINKEANSDIDAQILTGFVAFNSAMLKTNFFNKSKSAISFRLDPNLLAHSDYPKMPFGLFFLMGTEFQGFHVRFADVARGGVRIIRSVDQQIYNHNLGTSADLCFSWRSFAL
jgi:glutamate dehydrogenase